MAPRTKALWIIEQHNGSAKHAIVTAEILRSETNKFAGPELTENDQYWEYVIFFIKQRL